MNNISYDKNVIRCTKNESTFTAITSLENTVNILVKEGKKTVSYSLDIIEEKALYEFLKGKLNEERI
jgi:glutaredoxin 2